MSIGDRITKAREKAGLSKAELARRVRVSRTAIGLLEVGDTKTPRGTTLLAIAKVTGVNAEWISSGKGPMLPETTLSNAAAQVLELPDSSVEGGVLMRRELLEYFDLLSPKAKAVAIDKIKALYAEEAKEAAQNPTERRA